MIEKEHIVTTMPVLALRGLTIFPEMVVHFDVGRMASIRALDQAMEGGHSIFLVSQKDMAVEEPGADDLYEVGTIANVRQILRLPEDNVRVMVEGVSRGRILKVSQTTPSIRANVESLPKVSARRSAKSEAMMRTVYDLFQHYTDLTTQIKGDILLNVLSSDEPGYIADYIAQNILMRVGDKQAILEELRPVRRLERLAKALSHEVEVLEIEADVQQKVQEQLGQNQKDYYLREQMKVIQGELGEGESVDDIGEYRQRITDAKLPQTVTEKLHKELNRLSKQPFGSAEATVLRNYLDVCLELPWDKATAHSADVAAAKKRLDADHYGLEKVKERILEYIAVRQLSPDIKGQVLCLVGPPGVGKTSIAMSVAKAMHRNFARISLGGVHDEAEIRGHRKTYVGAMPGRIAEALRQAGSSNPLLLLDEIDKMTTSHQGDPASALLEVLDGEQNATFRDHFLELPLDLSNVVFFTTANRIDTIPRPLLDRMEVIELPSYTDEEKVEIAKAHLLPKERKRHGLTASQLRVTDDALRGVISGYTKESGVRVLNRQLASLCRKAAMAVVSDDVKRISITDKNLEKYLGTLRYTPEPMDNAPQIGLVNGLAWTQVGGELLKVEVNILPGTGKVELTGNLGKVMQESAKAAWSYIRSRAEALAIDPEFYKNKDVHVHFPEGAVPKDGPSAGVAITTAMVSALTGNPVRQTVAMTGEVSLRGRVLPIGGLREKTMAALRNGVKTVIIPQANEKDLAEIDPNVRAKLHFAPVSQVDEVLKLALEADLAWTQTPWTPLANPTVTEPNHNVTQ